MGLDVHLINRSGEGGEGGTGIFAVDGSGTTREITRAEWDERFPGLVPVRVAEEEGDCVYAASMTHNVIPLAEEAGLYEYVWRPEEAGVIKAGELIEPLREGLARLRADAKRFKRIARRKRYTRYEELGEFVERYLAACEGFPDAEVRVGR